MVKKRVIILAVSRAIETFQKRGDFFSRYKQNFAKSVLGSLDKSKMGEPKALAVQTQWGIFTKLDNFVLVMYAMHIKIFV